MYLEKGFLFWQYIFFFHRPDKMGILGSVLYTWYKHEGVLSNCANVAFMVAVVRIIHEEALTTAEKREG